MVDKDGALTEIESGVSGNISKCRGLGLYVVGLND